MHTKALRVMFGRALMQNQCGLLWALFWLQDCVSLPDRVPHSSGPQCQAGSGVPAICLFWHP